MNFSLNKLDNVKLGLGFMNLLHFNLTASINWMW